MKRFLSALLSAVLLLSLSACAGTDTPAPAPQPTQPTASAAPADTQSFTDSLGRTVELPAQIDRVAVSGPMAQIALFALCPDKLVGVSSAWSKDAEQYLLPNYYNLPEVGQLYGGKGEVNLETLLELDPQVIIDIGEPKGSMAEDLDALQEQIGIPFIHVTATLENTGEAYRTLGKLLGLDAQGDRLGNYCDRVYREMGALSDREEKVRLLYVTGPDGQNVIAQNSYHGEIIDLMSHNLAVVDAPSSLGTGNEVGMEQLLLWDPEVILFEPNGVYATVAGDPTWEELTAISSGRYYEVPFGPYNWMGFPPAAQRYLGMLWLGKLLYPDEARYDLYEAVEEYYDLFYHCDLTREQFDALVANSTGKQ